MLPLPRRHAWLAAPPANTCSRNICPDNGNETHQRKTRTPRLLPAPAAACVAGRSTGQHMLPQHMPGQRERDTPEKNQNPSCCRSRGGMRGWPLPRPTHAPATTLKTNGNSAPIKPMSFPSSAWECVPRSSASQSLSRLRRPPPTLPLPRLPYPSFGRDRSSLLAVFCSCPISNSNCGSSDPAAFSATFACRSACSNNPSPSAARVR